jgi:hypothetical protein
MGLGEQVCRASNPERTEPAQRSANMNASVDKFANLFDM